MTLEELSVVVLELRREVDRLNELVSNPTPNKPRRFRPPTLEEVATRMKQRGLTTFTAEAFFAYYESVGWRIGNKPMRSWDAALTTWAGREHTIKPVAGKFIKFYTYNEICQMALTSNKVWQEYVALQLPDRPKPVWAHVNDASTNDLLKYKV